MSIRGLAKSGSDVVLGRWGWEESGFHPGGGRKALQERQKFCYISGNGDDNSLFPELISRLNMIIIVNIFSWHKAWHGVKAQ